MATKKKSKSVKNVLSEMDNPSLSMFSWRWTTPQGLDQALSSAQSGNIAKIQSLYYMAEKTCDTLGMCIKKRYSALPDWKICRRIIEGADETITDKQEEIVNKVFAKLESKGELTKAIKTLQSSAFRGIGAVKLQWGVDGAIEHLIPIKPWNLCIDPKTNMFGEHDLYWNPKADIFTDFKKVLPKVPEIEIAYVVEDLHIDEYALYKVLAQQNGYENYSRLIGRRGLPSTYLIMPDGVDDTDIPSWRESAKKVSEGGSGAFVNGTTVQSSQADTGAAQSIKEYIEHLDTKIIQMSTGGTLTSLAQATGLGSGVADAHMESWHEIILGDCKVISDAINRFIVYPMLRNLGFAEDLVYFDFDTEIEKSSTEVISDVASLKTAGFDVDPEQVKTKTGYEVIKASDPNSSTYFVPRQQPQAQVFNVDDVAKEEVEEVVEEKEEPNKKNVEQGTSLLKGFDKFLAPLKKILKNFTGKKEELAQAISTIDDLENLDESAFIDAVKKIYDDEVEKNLGDLNNE